jgi:hypothetical protein
VAFWTGGRNVIRDFHLQIVRDLLRNWLSGNSLCVFKLVSGNQNLRAAQSHTIGAIVDPALDAGAKESCAKLECLRGIVGFTEDRFPCVFVGDVVVKVGLIEDCIRKVRKNAAEALYQGTTSVVPIKPTS